MSNSSVYNDVPETRGIARNQGTYGPAGTGRDREDAARLAAFLGQQTYPDEPASVAYSGIPYEPRVPVAEGFLYEGEVTVIAGPGKSGKGLTLAAYAVRIAAGLPRPGEAPDVRHEPGRVLWVAGGAEDDPMHDLRPRFEAAAMAAAAALGLDPGEVLPALARIHDLSAWADGSPVEVPQDRDAIAAEVAALNELDGGPRVALVVMDPIKGLLGPGHNLNAGARRVMTPLQLLARGARCAVAVIMHVTSAGKVQGSPDVVNAVRLAFTVRPGKGGAPSALALYASNIAAPDDVTFTMAGQGPDVHAVFLSEAQAMAGQDGPGEVPATLRQRIAAHQRAAQGHDNAQVPADAPEAPAAGPAAPSPGDYAGQHAGAFKVLRMTRAADGQDGPVSVLGRSYPDRSAAKRAAEDAADVPALRWLPSGSRPGNEVALRREPDGGCQVFAVAPA